jgi:hypothetical protein
MDGRAIDLLNHFTPQYLGMFLWADEYSRRDRPRAAVVRSINHCKATPQWDSCPDTMAASECIRRLKCLVENQTPV